MTMLTPILHALLARDLEAIGRSVAAYPDDASLWVESPGIANPGGTLALHVAGNVQHYVGAVLGKTGYRRDRAAEFARRGVSRAEVQVEIDAAIRAVGHGLGMLTDAMLTQPYPEMVAGRRVRAADFLVHLAVHAGYHLGQLEYHRRFVTGTERSIGAMAISELPECVTQ